MIVVTRQIVAKDGKWELSVSGEVIGVGGYCQETDYCGCDGIWTTWGEAISMFDLLIVLGKMGHPKKVYHPNIAVSK